jgi:tetratricopeptide (TPR) repeat protein
VATEGLFHLMGLGSTGRSDGERRAQELIYDAWEMVHARDRIGLAKQALEIWPDCADAWVLLAKNMAESLEEAHELYTAGVEAGERAIGEAAVTEDTGHFWGILETRPYMRARLGLARILKEMGQIDEAVGHLRDMLRLNPADNQGNRYDLLHLLVEYERDDEAAELLSEYADDALAEWAYTGAFLAYRQHGASDRADELMRAALKRNAFVPAYLLGRRRIPKQLPATIGLGDNNEAIAYAADYKTFWRKTPAALDWLKSHLGKKSQ